MMIYSISLDWWKFFIEFVKLFWLFLREIENRFSFGWGRGRCVDLIENIFEVLAENCGKICGRKVSQRDSVNFWCIEKKFMTFFVLNKTNERIHLALPHPSKIRTNKPKKKRKEFRKLKWERDSHLRNSLCEKTLWKIINYSIHQMDWFEFRVKSCNWLARQAPTCRPTPAPTISNDKWFSVPEIRNVITKKRKK